MRRRLRVLMTADTVGGVWTYALDLARALAAVDVAIVLATMGRLPSAAQRAEAAQAGMTLISAEYRLEWMDEPCRDIARAGDWLLGIADRIAPDIIHLNGYAHGALPWSAPVLVVGHSCVLSWWEAVKKAPAPAQWNRYRDAVGRGIKAADAVVAPSNAMLSALKQHYPLPARCAVIYNGSHFAPVIAAKEELVFAAGRLWDEAKNLMLLDAAAPLLPWPVHLAGDNRSPDGRQLRLGNVLSHGVLPQAEIASWLGRAAIYAMPARYEPFGLSILEAARSGCALVLGDIASLREIWGEAALFVSPDDSAALAAAIRRLIDDPLARAALAARARRCANCYRTEAMAAAYRALYDDLAAADREAQRSRISA